LRPKHTSIGDQQDRSLSKKLDELTDDELIAVTLQTGDLVSAILATAERADLIAMPTKGHDGLWDVLRGSTTERVVRHAPCPVLALPVN